MASMARTHLLTGEDVEISSMQDGAIEGWLLGLGFTRIFPVSECLVSGVSVLPPDTPTLDTGG
jgi:hypothetical protein